MPADIVENLVMKEYNKEFQVNTFYIFDEMNNFP